MESVIEKNETKELIKFLKSYETKDAIELMNKYNSISRYEGSYGTRPAIHVFTFDILFNESKFSARGCNYYSYPNFEMKYGRMPSIVELNLREFGHKGAIETFFFEMEKWKEFYPKIAIKKKP